MIIAARSPQILNARAPKSNDSEDAPKPSGSKGITEVYEQYSRPINMAGGALLGVGIARYAGILGPEALSAAGVGALAGFFAETPKQGICMGGGAVIGAAIASFAGMPGAAVLSAAGTGTLAGWFASGMI